MILDLIQGTTLIHVTAQYSNAVLVAMLPYVSDVAKKLDLPIQQPLVQNQVVRCGILPYFYSKDEMAGCGVEIKGGWMFGFHRGQLNQFDTSHAYYSVQDPDRVPEFFGVVRMSKEEALRMARNTLKRLGIPLEAVFAEQDPRITLPPKVGTNMVARYRVEWMDPRADTHSVDIEINADAKRVERIYLSVNPALRRPWPKIGVEPDFRTKVHYVNHTYAEKLVPFVLHAIDEYGKALGLPIPRPLSTNHIARFHVEDNLGRPHCEVDLNSGWRFIFRDNMVNGFYAPDNLFNSEQRPILIKDFTGKWNMTESESIELIRRTLAKLNYPSNLVRMDFPPKVKKPTVPGIPRYSFWWWCENEQHDDLVSKVEAEVDAGKRELKSVYFENRAFWGKSPPINVPISLPQGLQKDAL